MSHPRAICLPQIRLEVLLESLVEHAALSVLEGELSFVGLSVSVLGVNALTEGLAVLFAALIVILITTILQS